MSFFKQQINNLINDNELSILYMSDLHFEFDSNLKDFNSVISEKHADVVVLAGDIAGGLYSYKFIQHLNNLGYYVIYVLGNHEFYGQDFNQLIKDYRILSENNDMFSFLEKDVLNLNGVDFIGTTLWTSAGTKDISEEIDFNTKTHLDNISDFKKINKFTPVVMKTIFYESFNFIKEAVNNSKAEHKVVITHHAPCNISSLEHYRANVVAQSSHVTELGNYISYTDISVWIHGHLHNSSDYFINETRILCNPRGYKDRNGLNENFTWNDAIIKFKLNGKKI